jgi:hypothetical protein
MASLDIAAILAARHQRKTLDHARWHIGAMSVRLPAAPARATGRCLPLQIAHKATNPQAERTSPHDRTKLAHGAGEMYVIPLPEGPAE